MKTYHGLLLLYKEKGYSSHDLVAKVRRLLNTKEVGHAGTLDPLAEGLMCLLIGEGTKLSSYILEQNKEYIAELELGKRTDSFDITGTIVSETPVEVDSKKITEEVLKLKGSFDWPVPIFSAVKVNGEKLYNLARKKRRENEAAESGNSEEHEPKAPPVIPIKNMTFFEVELVKVESPKVTVRLFCSKGSYVRTWISQLGESLRCGATMTALVRTKSLPFSLKQALKLEQMQALVAQEKDLPNYIPMNQCLGSVPNVKVQGASLSLMLNGQISNDLKTQLISIVDPENTELIKVVSTKNEDLVALIGFEKNVGFKIKRVFRY